MSISSLAPDTTTDGWAGSITTGVSFCLFCENGPMGLPFVTNTSPPDAEAENAGTNAATSANSPRIAADRINRMHTLLCGLPQLYGLAETYGRASDLSKDGGRPFGDKQPHRPDQAGTMPSSSAIGGRSIRSVTASAGDRSSYRTRHTTPEMGTSTPKRSASDTTGLAVFTPSATMFISAITSASFRPFPSSSPT